MCFLVVNCNVLIALGSSSVLQNFWCNLPFKKSTRHSRTLLRLLGNLTIYDFPRVPLRFLVHFGSRTEFPGPRIKISKNEKKTPPGIHPSFKCTKFQTDFTTYTFPRAFQRFFGPFSVQDRVPRAQKSKFS